MFYKREIRLKIRKGKVIQWVVFSLLLVYLIVTIVSQQALIDEKNSEYNKAVAKLDEETQINLELQKEYASIGTDEYYEKIAREIFGYVYPGEKVFYESKS